jgi:5-methylcytosine-specific restriction endonuclease McrA
MNETVADVRLCVERVPGSGALRVSTSAGGFLRHETFYGYGPGEMDGLADGVAAFVKDAAGVDVRRDDYVVPTYGAPFAYVVDHSFYVCAGCADDDVLASADEEFSHVWSLSADGETDMWVVCMECGVLIAENLTGDGVELVRDTVFGDGHVDARHMVQLLDAYGCDM